MSKGCKLLEAENAAVDYMAAHGLTATNGMPEPSQPPPYKASLGGLAAQQLTSLQDDLANARTQLAIKQTRLHEIDTMHARGAGYDSLPEAASSPIIAELTKHDAELRVLEARLTSTYKAGNPGARSDHGRAKQHRAPDRRGDGEHCPEHPRRGRPRA